MRQGYIQHSTDADEAAAVVISEIFPLFLQEWEDHVTKRKLHDVTHCKGLYLLYSLDSYIHVSVYICLTSDYIVFWNAVEEPQMQHDNALSQEEEPDVKPALMSMKLRYSSLLFQAWNFNWKASLDLNSRLMNLRPTWKMEDRFSSSKGILLFSWVMFLWPLHFFSMITSLFPIRQQMKCLSMLISVYHFFFLVNHIKYIKHWSYSLRVFNSFVRLHFCVRYSYRTVEVWVHKLSSSERRK